jgi:hypothetical protein
MVAGVGVGLLLISLAAGYLVWTKATTEKGASKYLGYVVALVIIILSLLSVLCALRNLHCGYGMGKWKSCITQPGGSTRTE